MEKRERKRNEKKTKIDEKYVHRLVAGMLASRSSCCSLLWISLPLLTAFILPPGISAAARLPARSGATSTYRRVEREIGGDWCPSLKIRFVRNHLLFLAPGMLSCADLEVTELCSPVSRAAQRLFFNIFLNKTNKSDSLLVYDNCRHLCQNDDGNQIGATIGVDSDMCTAWCNKLATVSSLKMENFTFF